MSRGLDRLLAIAVVCLVGADWLSKIWITSRMALGESIRRECDETALWEALAALTRHEPRP